MQSILENSITPAESRDLMNKIDLNRDGLIQAKELYLVMEGCTGWDLIVDLVQIKLNFKKLDIFYRIFNDYEIKINFENRYFDQ